MLSIPHIISVHEMGNNKSDLRHFIDGQKEKKRDAAAPLNICSTKMLGNVGVDSFCVQYQLEKKERKHG